MSESETRMFPIDQTSLMATPVFLVGRDDDCGLRLEDPTVSRRHARVTAGSTSVIVEDLGSSNGTWINGVRADAPIEVQIGSQVRFGQVVFYVSPSQDGSCATLSPDPGHAAPASHELAGPTAVPGNPTAPGGAPARKSNNMIIGIAIGSVIAVLAVIGVIVVVVLAGSASKQTDKPAGFNDPSALANSVTSSFNADLAEQGYSYRVDTTSCIQAPSGEFTCLLEYSDGDRLSVTVTVAADGQSWISR